MYSVFVKLMEEKGLTPYRVAKETGVTQATLSRWKTGKVNPSLETLQILADYFHVSIDYLTGKSSEEKEKVSNTQKAPALNKRDERDIKKKMEEMLDLFNSDEALMFDGEPLDDETRQLLKDSYENQLRMTKALAKEKYTPNKYKNK